MADETLVAAIRREGAAGLAVWREAHPKEHLRGADLVQVDLYGANLSRADLSGSILSNADISGADLSGAQLIDANLNGTNLGRADLSGAVVVGCDMSACVGLESAHSDFPSSIGVDTLIRTLRSMGGEFSAEQRHFFIESGVPETLLLYLPSALTSDPLQFYPSMLSYANEDPAFTGRLYRALQAHKVKVWWFPESALGGRPVWANIDRAIQSYEKLIVVCSEDSLNNDHVLREIERALEKEAGLLRRKKDHPTIDADVLIPLTLDGFVFDGWQHHLEADVLRKTLIDFRDIGAEEGYQAALGRLMRALNPRAWPVG